MRALFEWSFRHFFRAEYSITLWCRTLRLGQRKKRIVPPEINLLEWKKIYSIIQKNNLQIPFKNVLVSQMRENANLHALRKQLTVETFLISHFAARQQKEFNSIITDLSLADAQFLVMKTFLYSSELYGNVTSRVSLDLDLLIPVEAFHRARRILESRGYKLFQNDKINDFYVPRAEEIFLKGKYEIELHTAIVDTSFESHVMSTTKSRLLTQELFDRGVKKKYLGTDVVTFSPTDLVLSLFLHAFYQHNFIGLRRYYDLARLIERHSKDIDWTKILSTVKRYNFTIYFLWYISFFNTLFPSLVPRWILQKNTKLQERFTYTQLFLYYFLRHKIFYPKNEFSDKQKRLIWAAMDGRLSHLVIQVMKNRLKKNFSDLFLFR